MNKNNDSVILLSILVTGLIANILAYYFQGIMFTIDSGRYMGYANEINNGNWQDLRNMWCISYPLTLVGSKFLFGSMSAVVIVQVFCFLVSCIIIFKLNQKETNSGVVSLIFTLGYILLTETLSWNFYILTESLFTSLVLMAVYFWSKEYNRGILIPAGIVLVVFTFFLRPNGILFLTSLGVAFAIRYISRHSLKKTTIVGIISTLLLLSFTLLVLILSNFNFSNEYLTGEIVYGVSRLVSDYNITGLLLDSKQLITNSNDGIIGIVDFILDNPMFMLNSAVLKLFYFVIHIKPYYSIYHNIFIVITLYPVYFLAFLGFRILKHQFLKVFITVFILLTCLSVMVTWETWDGRILFPLLPFIFFLAGVGMYGSKERILKVYERITIRN